VLLEEAIRGLERVALAIEEVDARAAEAAIGHLRRHVGGVARARLRQRRRRAARALRLRVEEPAGRRVFDGDRAARAAVVEPGGEIALVQPRAVGVGHQHRNAPHALDRHVAGELLERPRRRKLGEIDGRDDRRHRHDAVGHPHEDPVLVEVKGEPATDDLLSGDHAIEQHHLITAGEVGRAVRVFAHAHLRIEQRLERVDELARALARGRCSALPRELHREHRLGLGVVHDLGRSRRASGQRVV
jgi:hypothetical protein